MSSHVEELPRTPSRTPIAPWWHTSVLVALFLVVAVMGALFQSNGSAASATKHPDMSLGFLTMIAMEWGLFFYITRAGLVHTGTSIWEVVGGRWQNGRDVMRDVAMGIGLWLLWIGLELTWTSGASGGATSIERFLPRSVIEIGLWIAVSVSAGICEEFVFRGYLMRQFEVLTGNRWIALILQAVLFGVSHGYQGWTACIRITLFGLIFGCLATWRRSLKPGMVAHACTDIVAGLFRG